MAQQALLYILLAVKGVCQLAAWPLGNGIDR